MVVVKHLILKKNSKNIDFFFWWGWLAHTFFEPKIYQKIIFCGSCETSNFEKKIEKYSFFGTLFLPQHGDFRALYYRKQASGADVKNISPHNFLFSTIYLNFRKFRRHFSPPFFFTPNLSYQTYRFDAGVDHSMVNHREHMV